MAMLDSVVIGGKIFLAFPSEDSTKFPSRVGCLNYFDDSSHKKLPPRYEKIIDTLRESGFRIVFSASNYKPPILWFLGLFLEPISSYLGKVLRGTWEYYGFEAIIWAEKVH